MESQNLIETFTEEQQMQVFNLMALGDIEDINLAAQLLFEASFDVNKAAQRVLDMQNKVNNPFPTKPSRQKEQTPDQITK